MFYYYRVQSSHWSGILEFKSKTKMNLDQCFRILEHDNPSKKYPTRFKVIGISTVPVYTGNIVEVLSMDLTVDKF
jgi:hypothetical protein